MAIPTSISEGMISGIVGTLSHWGPMRVLTAVIDSTDEANNVFGRAFTYADESVETVQAGGEGFFAGILVHPEAWKLGETQENGSIGEFLDMGEIYVEVDGADASSIGDPVYYAADGSLTAAAEGGTEVPNARIARHLPSAETPNLVLIRLTN